jgi:DNA-binding MarR family transcriptional regulator
MIEKKTEKQIIDKEIGKFNVEVHSPIVKKDKKRAFKGVWIPKEIWLDEKLNWKEKLFLVEIDSLDNEDGCYASNKHFAEFFQMSENRSSEIIKSLYEKGYITRRYIKEGKQIKKRIITVIQTAIRKTDEPIRIIEGGYSENRKDNNTYINNTKSKSGLEKNIDKIKKYDEYKNIYNEYLLAIYKQDQINSLIYTSKKQRQSLTSLIKRFDDDATFRRFCKEAFDDIWRVEQGCLPALLISQYDKICAQMAIKENKKQPTQQYNYDTNIVYDSIDL